MLPKSFWPLAHLLGQIAERRLRLRIGAATLLVVASGALAALAPLALKSLVDAASTTAKGPALTGDLFVPAAIYVAAVLGARILSDLRPLFIATIDQQMMASLRQQYFGHVLHLPMAGLLRRRTGELLHTLDMACTGTQLILTHLIQSIAPVVVELLVMTIVLVQLRQPALVGLFGMTAALYFAVFAAGAKRLNQKARAVTAASLEVNAHLAEGMANVEMLRCFGGETSAQRALASASSSLVGRWHDYYSASTCVALAATLIFAASLAACLAITADGLHQGALTVGGFVLGSVYLMQMIRPIEVLGSATRDLARAQGFIEPALEVFGERLEPLGAEQRSVQPPPTPAEPLRRPISIRLEALRFGYEPEKTIIDRLDLDIAAGTTTAVVGPSGSGKSTLIRLLLRLYEPQGGRILLDGHPISNLPLRELRSQIALVPQDTPLLHASIASNISLGMPGADQQAIVSACGAAQLHAVVHSLPDGYETLVGERGLKLSGGERQRLAIARAVLRRPSIFLLDEPTSMLDSKTEAEVLHALKEVTKGSTTLIVAHRLSTVMHADDIVVMDQGRIRERGRHHELLEQDGLYAQLWRCQSESDSRTIVR